VVHALADTRVQTNPNQFNTGLHAQDSWRAIIAASSSTRTMGATLRVERPKQE
jgi:hypothetical protein